MSARVTGSSSDKHTPARRRGRAYKLPGDARPPWLARRAARVARAVGHMGALRRRGARRGLDHLVVCGMGGSSLAPHVLATSFDARACTVLDSTDPGAVLDCQRGNDPARTLYLISSKSGTTVETLSCY